MSEVLEILKDPNNMNQLASPGLRYWSYPRFEEEEVLIDSMNDYGDEEN
jgi:hypothetical protein